MSDLENETQHHFFHATSISMGFNVTHKKMKICQSKNNFIVTLKAAKKLL